MSWDFRKLGTRVCVCYDVTNRQAHAAWEKSDQPSIEDLTKNFSCGDNCGRCIPYFRTLLKEYQCGSWPTEEVQSADQSWFGSGEA